MPYLIYVYSIMEWKFLLYLINSIFNLFIFGLYDTMNIIIISTATYI
jgi:hypothetical protein